jgi:hypothetical protein
MPKEQPFTADTMKKMKESAPKFVDEKKGERSMCVQPFFTLPSMSGSNR